MPHLGSDPSLATPVRLVCFDLGGVIMRIHRAWSDACAAAGVPVRGDPMTDESRNRRRPISELYHTGRISTPEFLDRMSDAFGGLHTRDEIRRVHDAFLIEEYPGIDGVIARLARTPGIETGVLSNTNETHWARLGNDEPGPMRRFPTALHLTHRHASHLLGLAKPNAEIYRAFESRVGRHGPEILFFDDLEENIKAARDAGWAAERIDHTGDTAVQIEQHLIEHGIWQPDAGRMRATGSRTLT